MDNPDCELNHWFPREFPDPAGEEVHHVISVRQRPDLLSNLLTVSRDAHRFCTEKPNAGRALALFVKLRKDELDPYEFWQASGILLPGYLLKIGQSLEFDWVRSFWEILVEEFP